MKETDQQKAERLCRENMLTTSFHDPDGTYVWTCFCKLDEDQYMQRQGDTMLEAVNNLVSSLKLIRKTAKLCEAVDSSKEMMSVIEVARLLSLPTGKVMKFIESGELTAINVGNDKKRGSYRIQKDSLDSFLAARIVQTEQETEALAEDKAD
jgi:excisionase family DNA binding protein